MAVQLRVLMRGKYHRVLLIYWARPQLSHLVMAHLTDMPATDTAYVLVLNQRQWLPPTRITDEVARFYLGKLVAIRAHLKIYFLWSRMPLCDQPLFEQFRVFYVQI